MLQGFHVLLRVMFFTELRLCEGEVLQDLSRETEIRADIDSVCKSYSRLEPGHPLTALVSTHV